jgi:primosomal replication protein N
MHTLHTFLSSLVKINKVPSGIARNCKCLLIHLDNKIPNSDFPKQYSFAIVLTALGRVSYHLEMYDVKLKIKIFLCSFKNKPKMFLLDLFLT